MPFRFIEMETYPRRAHFGYFRTLAYPYVGITVNVDVTGLPDWCRREGHSFYLTVMHAAALAADGVSVLRQRIRDGRIVEYTECPTSHTEASEDGTYHYCTVHHHMADDEYFRRAEQAREACRGSGLEEDEDVESFYFISTVPWLHYTALIQPVAAGDESNPRITWGRYEETAEGRLLMPVTLLAHHALVDGVHLAQFYENLAAEIRRYASGR